MFNDGDVDLADMQLFQQCFGVDVNNDWCCGCANVDAAVDEIDLADWAAMQSLIDGPQ